jgi:hypothetical protein
LEATLLENNETAPLGEIICFLQKLAEVVDLIDKNQTAKAADVRQSRVCPWFCCSHATEKPFIDAFPWKSPCALVEYTQLPQWRLAQGLREAIPPL